MFANFDFQLRDVDIYLGSIRSSAFLLSRCSFNNVMQLCYANGILPKQKFIEVTFISCYHLHEKYLQSDWLRGVQYWPHFYSVFNICTL